MKRIAERVLFVVITVVLTITAATAQTAGAQGTVSNPQPSDTKAQALMDKMVQALGGQAYLTVQDMEQSGRVYGFSHGEPTGAGSPFWSYWKWPDKDRVELLKHRDWIVINNGDKGYDITYHGTANQESEALQDYLRRRHYSTQTVLREWLKQPGTALFYEGTATADRRPADKVTVMNTKNEAVTFYIDQNTFLPLKKVFVWRDPTSRDRTEESEIYDKYRAVQGIMTPFSVTRQRDGLNTNQRFIFEVKYNQNLSDAMFEPKAGAQTVEANRKK